MKRYLTFIKDVATTLLGLAGLAVSLAVGAVVLASILLAAVLRRRVFWILVTVVSGLVLAAVIFSACVILACANGRTFDKVDDIPHREVGLVLGCRQTMPGGYENPYFSARMQAAADLYRAGKVDYFIVSGDNHIMEYNEPIDMSRALQKLGVPEDRIYLDYAGFRTLDSVVRAREIFDQTKITIISQQFHNQRAIFIARHEGIDAIGFNAPDQARSKRVILREMFARVKTVLDTWLLGTEPKFYGPKVEIKKVKK